MLYGGDVEYVRHFVWSTKAKNPLFGPVRLFLRGVFVSFGSFFFQGLDLSRPKRYDECTFKVFGRA